MQNKEEKMHEADEPLYFTIDLKNNQVELTDRGREFITQGPEEKDLYILPDVNARFTDIEKDVSLSDSEKVMQKDELGREYGEKSEILHALQQLLKAYTLFDLDVEYIMQDGKVMIVDEQTGRVLAGRRYSDGLHQAIEAKENVKIEKATQTYATVTLQNYFRMYHKLSGMTGTAETEEEEFHEIYKLDVVVIPTNRPITRKDEQDFVFKTQHEKFEAVINELDVQRKKGRPILVGTTSVEISELLSRMMRARKFPHEVLNAKYHQREAEIVAKAGAVDEDGYGNITVATNMAGRGTDIKLSKEVIAAGGLTIIGTARHESRRIDRQLRGRAGRQGDAGSSQFYVSLEDDLMRMFGSERIAKIMDRLGLKEGEVIQHSMISKSIGNAQQKVEQNNFGMRKRLLEYDDVMNRQREVIYARRRNALYGDKIKIDIDNMLYDLCVSIIARHADFTDAGGLSMDAIRLLSVDPKITERELNDEKQETLAMALYEKAKAHYKVKTETLAGQMYEGIINIQKNNPKVERILIPFAEGSRKVQIVVDVEEALETKGMAVINELEKVITLNIIDDSWKKHLREMDDLRQAVQNAVFEQKDPLLIYKRESFEIFQFMLGQVNESVLSTIFKANLEVEEKNADRPSDAKRDDFSKLKTRKDEVERERDAQKQEERRIMAAGSGDGEDRPLSRAERRAKQRKKGGARKRSLPKSR